MGMCGVCPDVRGCAWVCMVCTGMHGYTQVCASVHTCTWVGAGVHVCVWKFAEVRGCLRVCVLDEFSEYLLETRVNTSADFNTYPIRIFCFTRF